MAAPKSTRPANRSRTPRPLDDATRLRLASCYALLVRASVELGIKAEGSAKLSRALQDVCTVRDALCELADPLVSSGPDEPLDFVEIRRLVFETQHAARTNWDYWRTREHRKRAGLDPRTGL